MQDQKEVKLINFTAEKFGLFKAVELDFQKFKSGVLAVKGNVGQGKSTLLNGVQTSTSGIKKLSDAEQYGDEWKTELNLLDGEHKVLVRGVKVKDKSPKYTLYEIDANGKKVTSPIIDGEKATHKAYLEKLTTALTFGIKDFLSENNTTQTKFMFSLFADELKKLGVEPLIEELEGFTMTRDKLRSECTHLGAFMEDFKREGLTKEDLEILTTSDLKKLQDEKTKLLVEKGQIESGSQAILERKRNAIQQRGNEVANFIRDLRDLIQTDYDEKKKNYDDSIGKITDKIKAQIEADKQEYKTQTEQHKGYIADAKELSDNRNAVEQVFSQKVTGVFSKVVEREASNFIGLLNEVICHAESLIGEEPKQNPTPKIVDGKPEKTEGMRSVYTELFDEINALNRPIKPSLPVFENGKLKTKSAEGLHEAFAKLYAERTEIGVEYMNVEAAPADTTEIEAKIQRSENEIKIAERNNKLLERYEANRAWVEADAKVLIKRKDIQKLYAQISTGVEGLSLTPFYNKDGKMTIKTTYTGVRNPKFFANEGGESRLLHSYSFTQRGLIASLLQASLLKKKSKCMPYLWLDDVPQDSRSMSFLAEIAEQEGLNVIVSVTGDFDKEKLTENEMLVDGGEVFFQ